MLLNVFILSSIILVPAVLGIGVKLLFDKNAEMPSGCCNVSFDQDDNFTCACGTKVCKIGSEKE
jgi:hypothetical protein